MAKTQNRMNTACSANLRHRDVTITGTLGFGLTAAREGLGWRPAGGDGAQALPLRAGSSSGECGCKGFLSWGFHDPPASFLSIGPASQQTLHIIPRVLGTLQREKESETESEKQRNETDGNREVGKRATVIYPEWGRYERHARGEGGRQRQKRGSPDAEVKIYPVSPVHRPGSRAQRGLVLCPRPPRKLVAESDLVCGPADSWLFSL